MSATATVLDFARTASLEDMPEELLVQGRRAVTDGFGVLLAGATEDCSRIVQEQIAATGGRQEATVFGTRLRAPATLAARANGTAGHAMDYDDTQLSNAPDRIFGLLTHPTVAPLAAALAVAEREGSSGRDLLEAFLVGFEVECAVSEAIHPRHYQEGFHSTATVGTIGAAVTAARLMGLERARLSMALGIAASLASGIRLGFGTMTKPLHAGRAAENGVLAADLATRGFTAGRDPLEAPWGFFRVFGGGYDPERLAPGDPWTLLDPGVSVKPFPSGSLGHPSVAAMLELVEERDLRSADVAAIEIRAGRNILNPLRYGVPSSPLEAKFSLPFVLSAALLRRRVGIAEFQGDFFRSAEAVALMRRVTVRFDEEIDRLGYDRMRSSIEIRLRDGSLLRTTADTYPGGPERPLTGAELRAKFTECARLVLDEAGAARVLALIERVDDAPRAHDLVEAHAAALAGGVD